MKNNRKNRKLEIIRIRNKARLNKKKWIELASLPFLPLSNNRVYPHVTLYILK